MPFKIKREENTRVNGYVTVVTRGTGGILLVCQV